MKRFMIVLLAALVPLLAGTAQDSAPLITLQQSIDAALANGDDNKVLQGNLDVARAQHALNVSKNSFTLAGSAGYGQSWPFGDPTLVSGMRSAGASGGSSATPTSAQAGLTLAGPLTSIAVSSSPFIPASPPATPNATSAVSLSVSQNLWNGYWGGPSQAVVDKSLLTLQGKELATASSRLGLIFRIKQAYYAALAAQRNVTLKREILDKQNAVLKQIKAIYDLKQASLVDLNTAKINAKSAQIDVDIADHELRFARAALANLMGMPPDTSFMVADAADPVVPVKTVEEAIAEGLKRRVELDQAELSVKSASVDLALARGLGTPTVSVSGSLSLLLDWGKTVSNAGSAAAGVRIAMPILDAGATQNQVDAFQGQSEVYALQVTQLQKNITTDIRNAWEGVQIAAEKLDLARLQAEASMLQNALVRIGFDKGTASNQDLLTATVNEASAQTALEAAKSTAQLAVLQLHSVMGY
ncbi:MAG: TolC family protein [Spirochaetes bacterium]|nr:TolC family protein [Spirochaetota bacterium]